MKRRRDYCHSLLVLMMPITNTSCEHIPTRPIVEYDSDKAVIQVIQTDTAAHDSAFISIGSIYQSVIPIKDTVSLSITGTIKKLNQIEVAYKLATHDNTFDVTVRTSRTSDTIFHYRYNTFDIKPINVAEVVSGPCRGFYDVNNRRDYHGKIRQWIFNNNLSPDSSVIETANSILRQFNYSGKNEYSALNNSIPIVNSLSGLKFRFKAQLEGDYFYLYAYSCSSGKPIKSFVESKITKGLNDAHHSIGDEFACSNNGGSGPNVLFLVGIDKNWKYEALPVGIILVDDIAPEISTRGYIPTRYRGSYYIYGGESSLSWSKAITLPRQNMVINIPNISASISSYVSVSYGNFEGNDYFGYNIPFYVAISGDVQSLTIGSHRLNGSSIKNDECIRLHIRGLHTGDNSLPLTAVDSRGNKSTSSLSIPLVTIRNNPSYHDDDDYDDLEDRISDLESRLDDLDD